MVFAGLSKVSVTLEELRVPEDDFDFVKVGPATDGGHDSDSDSVGVRDGDKVASKLGISHVGVFDGVVLLASVNEK